MPIWNDPPRRLLDALRRFRKDRREQGRDDITRETVQATTDSGGVIKNRILSTTGRTPLRVGQQVYVANVDGRPQVILADTARRAQFPQAPLVAIGAVVEELFVAVDSATGQEDVFFRNYDQITKLGVTALFPAGINGPITSIGWGHDPNGFWVRCRKGPLFETQYLAFELGSGVGGTFVRRDPKVIYPPGRKATVRLQRHYDLETMNLQVASLQVALAATPGDYAPIVPGFSFSPQNTGTINFTIASPWITTNATFPVEFTIITTPVLGCDDVQPPVTIVETAFFLPTGRHAGEYLDENFNFYVTFFWRVDRLQGGGGGVGCSVLAASPSGTAETTIVNVTSRTVVLSTFDGSLHKRGVTSFSRSRLPLRVDNGVVTAAFASDSIFPVRIMGDATGPCIPPAPACFVFFQQPTGSLRSYIQKGLAQLDLHPIYTFPLEEPGGRNAQVVLLSNSRHHALFFRSNISAPVNTFGPQGILLVGIDDLTGGSFGPGFGPIKNVEVFSFPLNEQLLRYFSFPVINPDFMYNSEESRRWFIRAWNRGTGEITLDATQSGFPPRDTAMDPVRALKDLVPVPEEPPAIRTYIAINDLGILGSIGRFINEG